MRTGGKSSQVMSLLGDITIICFYFFSSESCRFFASFCVGSSMPFHVERTIARRTAHRRRRDAASVRGVVAIVGGLHYHGTDVPSRCRETMDIVSDLHVRIPFSLWFRRHRVDAVSIPIVLVHLGVVCARVRRALRREPRRGVVHRSTTGGTRRSGAVRRSTLGRRSAH